MQSDLPDRSSRAVALCNAGMIALAFAGNLIPVCLTSLSAELGGAAGLTKEQLGRIGATTFVGLVAGMLASGPLADRFGAKLFVVAGNLLLAAGLAMLGRAGSYSALLASALVVGIGAGVLDMILSPVVCALRPHRRTAAMNWLHSFYCIGAVFTILVASLAMKRGVSWRSVAVGLAVLPLALAAGFSMLRLPALIREGVSRTRLRDLIRMPHFLVALVAMLLAGASELGIAQWMPAYGEYVYGFSKWQSSLALLGFSVAMAVGRLGAGAAGTRFPTSRAMTVCCWATAALYLVASAAPWREAGLAACVLAGLTVSCLWPSLLGLTGDRFPAGGASMFAWLAAMGNAGGALMPWGVGIVADATSLRWGLAAAGICPLLLVAALARLRSPNRNGERGAAGQKKKPSSQ
jgi:fucose permease